MKRYMITAALLFAGWMCIDCHGPVAVALVIAAWLVLPKGAANG